MKRAQQLIVVFIVLLALGIWQLVTLLGDIHPITNLPPKGTRIVALGDSLVVGVGASDPEHGFVPLLARRVGVPIVNKGVSGNTTHDALLRLSGDMLEERPDIVIILLGGNDYLRRVPESETFKNLQMIITQIQAKGAVVVLLGIQGGVIIDHFASQFKTLARETGSLYVPNVLLDIIGNSTLMSDEVHPNDKGYEKMVDRVAPSLIELIALAPGRVSPE